MPRESFLIFLGILVMLLPFIGLPLSVLVWVYPVIGLLIALVGVTLRARRNAPPATGGDYDRALQTP